jgi:hypothetical protein
LNNIEYGRAGTRNARTVMIQYAAAFLMAAVRFQLTRSLSPPASVYSLGTFVIFSMIGGFNAFLIFGLLFALPSRRDFSSFVLGLVDVAYHRIDMVEFFLRSLDEVFPFVLAEDVVTLDKFLQYLLDLFKVGFRRFTVHAVSV